MTAATKPFLVSRGRNPLAALERLPGWWLGKAETRRTFAREAQALHLDKLADEHLRAATEYERRVKEIVHA